jgi:hypothetical protein
MPKLTPELESKIKTWIKEQRKKGSKNSEIRSAMLDKGYSNEIANKLLRKSNVPNYILYALIIVLIGIGIYFLIPFITSFVSGLSAQVCSTQDCFIAAANECKSVKIQQNEAGSLFDYSEKNCILTKTLTKMNETEPQEMVDLLQGKSLTCTYAKGSFNTDWINTLSLSLENCSGDLKDAIDELAYAV